jgi:hypothetical protein
MTDFANTTYAYIMQIENCLEKLSDYLYAMIRSSIERDDNYPIEAVMSLVEDAIDRLPDLYKNDISYNRGRVNQLYKLVTKSKVK